MDENNKDIEKRIKQAIAILEIDDFHVTDEMIKEVKDKLNKKNEDIKNERRGKCKKLG